MEAHSTLNWMKSLINSDDNCGIKVKNRKTVKTQAAEGLKPKFVIYSK